MSSTATKTVPTSVGKRARKTVVPIKVRSSIIPGTVLILLAGRFKGKRVVYLKQLKSGLLLVTGPYKFNGVPLKRVNQAYVIATKTKIDISSIKVNEKIDDALFKKAEKKSGEKKAFFDKTAPEKKSTTSDARKALQREIDAQLTGIIKKTPLLRSYIGAKFSLKKGQAPHAMQF